MAELEEMTDDELESIVSTAVKDAVEFIDAEITPRRVLSQEMFDGQTRVGSEEGRSSVVRSVIRDTVRAVKPSLMRVFASHDKVVQFEPVGPEDVQTAEMATQAINHIFEQSNAYRLLDDAFQDAWSRSAAFSRRITRTTMSKLFTTIRGSISKLLTSLKASLMSIFYRLSLRQKLRLVLTALMLKYQLLMHALRAAKDRVRSK